MNREKLKILGSIAIFCAIIVFLVWIGFDSYASMQAKEHEFAIFRSALSEHYTFIKARKLGETTIIIDDCNDFLKLAEEKNVTTLFYEEKRLWLLFTFDYSATV